MLLVLNDTYAERLLLCMLRSLVLAIARATTDKLDFARVSVYTLS
jgi:hypothetical protein